MRYLLFIPVFMLSACSNYPDRSWDSFDRAFADKQWDRDQKMLRSCLSDNPIEKNEDWKSRPCHLSGS